MKPIYYVLDSLSIVTAGGESRQLDLNCYFVT